MRKGTAFAVPLVWVELRVQVGLEDEGDLEPELTAGLEERGLSVTVGEGLQLGHGVVGAATGTVAGCDVVPSAGKRFVIVVTWLGTVRGERTCSDGQVVVGGWGVLVEYIVDVDLAAELAVLVVFAYMDVVSEVGA